MRLPPYPVQVPILGSAPLHRLCEGSGNELEQKRAGCRTAWRGYRGRTPGKWRALRPPSPLHTVYWIYIYRDRKRERERESEWQWVQSDTIQYNAVKQNKWTHKTIQHDTIQHYTVQHSYNGHKNDWIGIPNITLPNHGEYVLDEHPIPWRQRMFHDSSECLHTHEHFADTTGWWGRGRA